MGNPTRITWETIKPTPSPESRGEVEILAEALQGNEACGAFLDQAVLAAEPVLLLVNDGHRATRTRVALHALASFIGTKNSSPSFRVLVATGTHTFPADERSKFEGAVFHDCGLGIDSMAWHDATDTESLVDVAGVSMHSWLAQSKFLLPIGSVEPHYFAGVTGAHKTVTIGCMSREAIEQNHAHAISPGSDIMQLERNPVFDGIASLLKRVQETGKTIFAINEIVRNDRVVAAAVGDPLGTVQALLPEVRRIYVHEVPEPVDLLHLKVPLPLGRNLYQADKALKNNHLAVRDGGGILLEAECPEGIGPDAFLNLLRRASDHAEAVGCVRKEGYRLGDHKAVKLRYLTDQSCRGVHVALVSPHISEADAKTVGAAVFADVPAALDWLIQVVSDPCERGLVVEDAGCVTTRAHSATQRPAN